MKKVLISLFAMAFLLVSVPAFSADIDLAKKSTLETILKNKKLRVGFESGYMPFEMTNTNGKYMGFDVDMAKASMELQKLTLNYNAMLSTIAKVNNLSLVNYMR